MNRLWAEDYYDSESLEMGGTFSFDNKEGLNLTLPEPATLSSKPSSQSLLLAQGEDVSPLRKQSTHQRSLTALLPFRNRSRENSTSPERKSPQKEKTRRELEEEFMPTLTGDNDGVVRIEEKQRGGLSAWFSGSSAPIPLGIPIAEQVALSPSNMSPLEAPPVRDGAKLRKKSHPTALDSTGSENSSPTKAPANTTPGRFNFFSSSKPQQKQTLQLPRQAIENDELLTLDINAALFPSSSPSAQDPFSPSAFKNLLINAEGILLRLQTAYKLRALSLYELSAEKEAQEEELEEAETRAQCLKSQLEEMSNRVAEQDRIMDELIEQLATEKQARAEEKLAREKSIALIKASRERSLSETEDMEFRTAKNPRPVAWRKSGGSTSTEFESDAELASPTDSVFSRSRSPALTITSTMSSATCTSADTTPEILQASFARVVSLQSPALAQRPSPIQQPSTFQKILHGISPPAPAAEAGCENCRCGDVSVAWDAVSLLRAENKGLKERVGSLEGAVETALDLCSGIGRF